MNPAEKTLPGVEKFERLLDFFEILCKKMCFFIFKSNSFCNKL